MTHETTALPDRNPDASEPGPAIEVAPGTIVVFADLGCPWAHLAIYRLHRWRDRLGRNEEVSFDVHAFPLELINSQPTPKSILDAEIPVVGGLEPAAGWQTWQRGPDQWPVTTLPALEAVAASKEQGLAASERLDRALRVALFAQSRTISMHYEILDLARTSEGVDEGRLAQALSDGRARASLFEDLALSEGPSVEGSPHLFFADGYDVHNPGIERHWEGEHGRGFPVVDKDDPSVYEDLVQRAAS